MLRREQEAETELSQDEISEILNLAIQRQASAPQAHEQAGTLEQAIEIARQLNVPEEHVLAAAEELRLRKHQAQNAEERALQRGWKRRMVRAGRQRNFLASLVAGVAGGAAMLLAHVHPDLLALLPLALPALSGLRLAMPVSDEEADRVEVPPRAGVCRVCGDEAHTPESTFCDRHRFKPGE